MWCDILDTFKSVYSHVMVGEEDEGDKSRTAYLSGERHTLNTEHSDDRQLSSEAICRAHCCHWCLSHHGQTHCAGLQSWARTPPTEITKSVQTRGDVPSSQANQQVVFQPTSQIVRPCATRHLSRWSPCFTESWCWWYRMFLYITNPYPTKY